MPVRSARTGSGSGTWGMRAFGGMLAELPGLEVLERLRELGPGVHHERPVRLDRLPDRATTQHQHLEIRAARVLPVVRAHPQPVAGAEHHQLPAVRRAALGADPSRAGKDVDERVEVRRPRQPQPGADGDRRVDKGHRRVRGAGPGVPTDLAGDDPYQRTRVRRREQGHLPGLQPLVRGRDHLVLARQVHPQLDAVEQPAVTSRAPPAASRCAGSRRPPSSTASRRR